jgi:hypothetical protein
MEISYKVFSKKVKVDEQSVFFKYCFSRRVGDSPIPGAGSYADNQVCKNLNRAKIFF